MGCKEAEQGQERKEGRKEEGGGGDRLVSRGGRVDKWQPNLFFAARASPPLSCLCLFVGFSKSQPKAASPPRSIPPSFHFESTRGLFLLLLLLSGYPSGRRASAHVGSHFHAPGAGSRPSDPSMENPGRCRWVPSARPSRGSRTVRTVVKGHRVTGGPSLPVPVSPGSRGNGSWTNKSAASVRFRGRIKYLTARS